jgi:hypothetical protein
VETEGATFRWAEFSLDNLIRPREHRRRNREAEAFTAFAGRLETAEASRSICAWMIFSSCFNWILNSGLSVWVIST